MTERVGGQAGGRQPGVQKSEEAFRTISEVAADLDLPQHVLRFWETRFTQVRPLKRAGGRRFYRPEDVALLRAVRVLLYDEGYTIKGVQRLLAEHGAGQVADAFARARAAAASRDEMRREGARDGAREGAHEGAREGENAAEMPKQNHPARREPAAAIPDPAVPRRIEQPTRPVAPAIAPSGVADRLSAVLADLAECARLLASVCST